VKSLKHRKASKYVMTLSYKELKLLLWHHSVPRTVSLYTPATTKYGFTTWWLTHAWQGMWLRWCMVIHTAGPWAHSAHSRKVSWHHMPKTADRLPVWWSQLLNHIFFAYALLTVSKVTVEVNITL